MLALLVLSGMFLVTGTTLGEEDLSGPVTDPGAEANGSVNTAEGQLVEFLFSRYLSKSHATKHRPVKNGQEPLNVAFGISLVQILQFDQKEQRLTTQLWKYMKWNDARIRWRPEDFDGIEYISLDSDQIWTPNIVLYNAYGKMKTSQDDAQVRLNYNGDIIWIPMLHIQSSCKLDVTNFPFDNQTCSLIFGSWTYDVTKLDLVPYYANFSVVDLEYFVPNVEWTMTSSAGRKVDNLFSCCKEPFAIVVYTLKLTRNSEFYIRVMILPIMALSVLSIFIFCIPVNRPDRTSIGLGLFTSFMLLLLLIVDNSPPSASCLLGLYVCLCIAIVTSIILLSIMFIHLSTWPGKLPYILRKIFLGIILRILFPFTHAQMTGGSGSGGSSKSSGMSQWAVFVSVLDRMMFIAYVVVLSLLIFFFFPREYGAV